MAGADTPLVLSAVAVWELRLKWHSVQISGTRKGRVREIDRVAKRDQELQGRGQQARRTAIRRDHDGCPGRASPRISARMCERGADLGGVGANGSEPG